MRVRYFFYRINVTIFSFRFSSLVHRCALLLNHWAYTGTNNRDRWRVRVKLALLSWLWVGNDHKDACHMVVKPILNLWPLPFSPSIHYLLFLPFIVCPASITFPFSLAIWFALFFIILITPINSCTCLGYN